jgi:hypothetical protein
MISGWTKNLYANSGCKAAFNVGGDTIAESHNGNERVGKWKKTQGIFEPARKKEKVEVVVTCDGTVPRGMMKDMYLDDIKITKVDDEHVAAKVVYGEH